MDLMVAIVARNLLKTIGMIIVRYVIAWNIADPPLLSLPQQPQPRPPQCVNAILTINRPIIAVIMEIVVIPTQELTVKVIKHNFIHLVLSLICTLLLLLADAICGGIHHYDGIKAWCEFEHGTITSPGYDMTLRW